MKYAISLLIGFLIAVIIWLYFQKGERNDVDVTKITKTLQDKVKRAETLRQNVIVKARQDSVKHDSITKVLDTEIARLKRTARKLRTVHVDTVLIQDKEVGAYAAMLDSIVVSQDSQISELKEQKAEQWDSFNQLITASDSTLKANQGLNDYLIGIEKQRTKKAKNKRFGIGPHIGYDFRNKVTFGASVNFDLIRF